MRNFNDLTWEEIEAIGDEAVAAIEKAIMAELETGSSRDLLGGDNASDLIAEVGETVLEEDMTSEFWKDNDMTDFKDLTYEEIREIDNDEAVDAIAAAIRAQLSTGDYYELTDKDDVSDLRAQIEDVTIRFRPRFCWEWTNAICEEYSTDECETMTGDDRSELEQGTFREIVIQVLNQGVAQDIWQDLCNRAWDRPESNPYYDTRESRAACIGRCAA